jgi:hypothetical protein
MPRSLAGASPAPVAVSHDNGPGIEPCRCCGNAMLDAYARFPLLGTTQFPRLKTT